MCNPITTAHPDVLLSKGVHEGFEWEVTANRMGYRCGYVRVPAGHPWHGKGYDEVDPYPDVHGGLTFAEPDTDCGKGGEDNAWWVGFDCAHAGDAPDPELPGYRREMRFPGDTVKSTAYVEAECRSLAEQAKAAAGATARLLPAHSRPVSGGPLDVTLALPRPLMDWLVASERELAAAGDEGARERLKVLLEGAGHGACG